MIRRVTLFPELAGPLGLVPGVLDGLGKVNVIIGPNGAGKSRLLSLVRFMCELAPRAEHVRDSLSQRLAVAQKSDERERLGRSLRAMEALAREDAILVDGENGSRRPSVEDRCIDLTYGSEISYRAITAAFPDVPGPERGMSFAAAHRSAPTFLRHVATALFYGRHPEAAQRPEVAEALREAERFNRIAASLLGKEVTPEVDVTDGFEIVANLGGRRFRLEELSAGEGALLTWAILLSQQAPSSGDAVVLIDEPELHLHPRRQQQVVSSLRAVLGGHGQLWAVTHSPVVARHPDVTNVLLVEQGAIRALALQPSSAQEEALGLVVTKRPLVLPGVAKPALGVSDFGKLRTTASLLYVDKTRFVEEVLSDPAEVLLFPRPRRFGKSLNLSTLRSFVEKSPGSEEREKWFEGLRVWESAEARRHFGRYPVIHLTLKDAKAGSFASLFKTLRHLVGDLFEEHRYLLESDALSAEDRGAFETILRREGEPEDYRPALKTLSRHLARHHGERVVILVDEYDTPLTAAYEEEYLDDAVRFFGGFFSAGLKDNPHLFKGVLTAILRIARESLFSDLNNLSVYSILRPEFADHFGFTEDEVERLCQALGAPELMSGLREWYNGYLFGGQVVFNPWSVLSCLASADKRLAPYWAKTSSGALLRKQLFEKGRGLSGELSALLRGEVIHEPIDENLVLRTLDTTPDAVWSLMLFSGYLKPAEPSYSADSGTVPLTMPNLEVKREIEMLVRDYFSGLVGGASNAERMAEGLLRGDEEVVQAYLNKILIHNTSVHDLNDGAPEVVYHVLMLGLLAFLEPRYEVRSNQEAGYGRYDVMLIPRVEGEPGVCVELKRLEPKREQGAPVEELEEALRQIEERGYCVELERRGARPIHKMAVVFDGRRAWARRGA